MNYSEMTDFEINCAVACGMGFEGMVFFDVDSSICSGPVWNIASCVTDDSIRVSRGNAFNPCNSWADAGPIIEINAIGLGASRPGDSRDWIAYCWKGNHCGEVRVKNSNPLRAAMIAFLMMQENNDEQ